MNSSISISFDDEFSIKRIQSLIEEKFAVYLVPYTLQYIKDRVGTIHCVMEHENLDGAFIGIGKLVFVNTDEDSKAHFDIVVMDHSDEYLDAINAFVDKDVDIAIDTQLKEVNGEQVLSIYVLAIDENKEKKG